jgi:hypothetical protein
MAKKKKHHYINGNHSFKNSQSYYETLFKDPTPKDIRDIAIKVFGSTYFTISSDK